MNKNIPDKVLEIRKGDIRDEKNVERFFEIMHIPKDEYPVNAWKIAKELGFEVLEASFRSDSISGYVFVQDKAPRILADDFPDIKQGIILNKNENIVDQSFTLAHEIAHYIFHMDENKQYYESYHPGKGVPNGKLKGKDYFDKTKEDEADAFAARMLMPEWIFRRLVEESPLKRDRRKLIHYLSLAFMVTEEAVRRRFKELSIVL